MDARFARTLVAGLVAGLILGAGPTHAAPHRPPEPEPTTRGSHVYVEDYCVVRDLATPFDEYPNHDLTVLDWTYALGPGYAPPDLVPASRAGFGGASGSKPVRSLVIADLAAMRAAAAAAGHSLQVQSAYRSYAAQEATFQHWVSQVGYRQALQVSARPGHSEHQLGTTLDLTSGGLAPWNYADWGATPAGAWVAANAWRYGFVMSYPRGAEPVTCYDYEPWHYRWIGRADARAARASGLTLRQYLDARLHARFVDIRFTGYESDITWIADRGITAGCRVEPARYCPELPVSRAQMASFLVRALGLSAGADVDAFVDDDGSTHERNINRLAYAGLTAGCGGDRYCPDAPVLRDQMASFLVRAFGLGTRDPPDAFVDDEGSIHERDINRLAEAGITAGCGEDRYCPQAMVGRDQMAALLHRVLR